MVSCKSYILCTSRSILQTSSGWCGISGALAFLNKYSITDIANLRLVTTIAPPRARHYLLILTLLQRVVEWTNRQMKSLLTCSIFSKFELTLDGTNEIIMIKCLPQRDIFKAQVQSNQTDANRWARVYLYSFFYRFYWLAD